MPDTPEPEPHPLLRAFDHIYLGADEAYWDLPSRARSLETLRRVFGLARSFRLPRRLHISTHPRVDPSEYAVMAALAGAPAIDVEACVADFHTRHAGHVFPAALLDPAGRMGRWP
jgi:hypothetical protein